MANKDLTADINFLFEIGNIRHIPRMWQRFGGYDFANLAEHHFRMFWIAMVIAAHEKGVDTGKMAKMILAHDIAESRAGDVDYLARQYVDRKEDLAISDMLQNTAVETEFLELVREYEALGSLEAKVAKDADNLDVDLELVEQAEHGCRLRELWADNRQFVAKEKLHTQTAKRLFEQLADANPHAWHINGRTRRNSGDWRDKPKARA